MESRRGARGLSQQGPSSRAPEALVDNSDGMANSIICTDSPGNILSTLTSSGEQHPLELVQEAIETWGRMQQYFDQMEERSQRIRRHVQHIDSLVEETRRDRANFEMSREMLLQCTGIPEPGALGVHLENTKQRKEASAQAEQTEQQDRMEVSQEQESLGRALEQLRQESSGQEHEMAQVCREKELLGREKAALEGRLAATERHQHDLSKQLAETRSAKESLDSRLCAAQQQISQLEVTWNHLEAQVLSVTQTKEVLEGEVKCLQRELEAERALRRQEREDTAQQLLQAEQQHHESLRLQRTAQQLEIKKLLQDLSSERERHHAEMQETLEQWEKEKAEREQEHKKVLFEMRQKVATLLAQQEEERTRFEDAKREVLLEEQKEKSALSEALLQTQGELSQAHQQVQQLRQELKEQQEKGQTIEANLQAELQAARSEVQTAQRRHEEELQGLKEEMNLLLEQREALQKQVGELTSQLAASRESQEMTVQRAQQDVREAQEESRQKQLEVEHTQKMLEEAKQQNKELQVHLQNLERERNRWEEVAQQNSELQASVNALESEKARLTLSLEEKHLSLRTLEENNLAQINQVSQLRSALTQAEELHSEHRNEMQELNTQMQAMLLAEIEKTARQATEEKQLLETEVSELRVRLQSSEERAEAMATQCKAMELGLRKTQAQRDNLRAYNQELLKQLEHIEQDWWKTQLKYLSRESALEKEATERQEEAVTLRQEVASLKRKLENLEKERKDVLHERELNQQQMRDVKRKNEMCAPEMRNHKENTQELEVEREDMQEELEHGAAALKKWREYTQVLISALNKSEIAKGSLKKRLDILKGESGIQGGTGIDLQSTPESLSYSSASSHEELSQEQDSSSWSLEQLSQDSSEESFGQGHALAQVCREEELLAQKADLEGRLAATEWLRQDLSRQLAETRSAKESLESRLCAAQQQISQLEVTREHLKAELQAELQAARSEVQTAQRRHEEELQGLKEEMNLLLEQREALQKQVGELTSQLAASRESQEMTVQRAQQDVREAQEESRQKQLEVEHTQKMLEEAKQQNKELQVHLQNLERKWSRWEEVAQHNSELQASVHTLEKEKARLLVSLEEKNQCFRKLEEQNLVLKNRVSRLFSALKQAEQLCSEHRRQMQELNTQMQAMLLAEIEKTAQQATEEKQLLETEVSELRVRLQSSEERAEAMATQYWWKTQLKRISRESALEKEATERQEEAVTLRQEVASLKRKLENLEKERKDVLHERELNQQQMRDVKRKNEMCAPEMRNHKENTQELEVEREDMQEELEHGAAALKKGREYTQVLTAALNKSEIAKGSLKKHLDILKGESGIQGGTGIDLQSTPESLSYSSASSHEELSQEQDSSSWSLEQLSQDSSEESFGQGHALAQVCREEELLAQKADLEGRLAATEWLRQDLSRQLAETRSAKESLESRLCAAQQQISQLEVTREHLKAELQAELQAARSEVQTAQRRHEEELQGLKEEMNLLLEQREALQKQVGELTSQLAASRESQEMTVQRAQQDVREAQEESRQKQLEVEHTQKKLEEAKQQNKELQVHLQNLERKWSGWEEVAQHNSELQASVHTLEKEKARLLVSLEEKNQCFRKLEEQNLVLKNRVSRLFSALKQAEQLCSEHRRQMQELNTQMQAMLLAEIEKTARQATEEKQLLETEVSELRVRLQSSEERAEAMATQCKAMELGLRKTQAQRDNLRAYNQELLKQLEHIEQDWWKTQLKRISRENALEKEATERQEEAVTLRQEVASLKRKLENLEKERKDVLVEPERRRIRTFRRVFLPDYITFPVHESAHQNRSTFEMEESSSSYGEQQPSC
nr:centrosome-associated protein CEP250 isoform X4 [Taeniopygia guttata]